MNAGNYGTYVRFECGIEDRWTEDFGPFEYVELTYDNLRVSPDGQFFAAYVKKGHWEMEEHVLFATYDRTLWWSDIIIFTKEIGT